MNGLTLIGIAAGVLTTGAWLPQVMKTIRTRSAHDFSWGYLAAFSLGVSLWALYGVLKQDIAIIAANVATLVLVALIAWVKAQSAQR